MASTPTRAVLYLDADILVYNSLACTEQELDWGDDVWTITTDHTAAYDSFHQRLSDLVRCCKVAGGYKEVVPVFCYSNTSGDTPNWRKAILPSYKSNRAKTRKPMGYPVFQRRLVEEQGAKAFSTPGWEGDDVIGTMVTAPNPKGVVRIVWSADKDLKQIPGLHLNTKEGTEVGLVTVTPEEGERFHMLQSLTGDPTDGYKGCPGMGPAKASKGLPEGSYEAMWPWVVECYENAGLSEKDALTQAQVARIRQTSDNNQPWRPIR